MGLVSYLLTAFVEQVVEAVDNLLNVSYLTWKIRAVVIVNLSVLDTDCLKVFHVLFNVFYYLWVNINVILVLKRDGI